MSCEQKLDAMNTKLQEQKQKQDKIIQILNEILKVLAGYTK